MYLLEFKFCLDIWPYPGPLEPPALSARGFSLLCICSLGSVLGGNVSVSLEFSKECVTFTRSQTGNVKGIWEPDGRRGWGSLLDCDLAETRQLRQD